MPTTFKREESDVNFGEIQESCQSETDVKEYKLGVRFASPDRKHEDLKFDDEDSQTTDAEEDKIYNENNFTMKQFLGLQAFDRTKQEQ